MFQNSDAVLQAAQDYIAQHGGLNPPLLTEGRWGQPIIVHAPSGEPHSWMVPLTVGEKLAGFVQVTSDLTVLRYSSFQRHRDTLEGCPPKSLWLDPHLISAKAASFKHKNEQISAPVLAFDQNPTRLAWAVSATDPAGNRRTIFVAGDFIYAVSPQRKP